MNKKKIYVGTKIINKLFTNNIYNIYNLYTKNKIHNNNYLKNK